MNLTVSIFMLKNHIILFYHQIQLIFILKQNSIKFIDQNYFLNLFIYQ
jgi:hypothetical protein